VAAVASPGPNSTAPCLSGLGDDGDATFLLGYLRDSDESISQYLFFQIQDGSAVRVGDILTGTGSDSVVEVFSQPSGFTALSVTVIGGSSLANWSHDGVRVSGGSFGTDTPPHFGSSQIGVDPSGGTAAVKTFFANEKGWITTYQRFDKTGAPETGEVQIDAGEHYVISVGVALSGHAFIVSSLGPPAPDAPPDLQARWVARDGTAISQPFALPSPGWPRLQFLMDGSLALGLAPRPLDPPVFVNRIEDGAAVAGPLPAWLQQRSGNALFAARSGKAYATWGAGGQCGSDLEVLASGSGKTCGCLHVPQLSRSTSVGRDGSLIVPHQNTSSCAYDLYPKLLR